MPRAHSVYVVKELRFPVACFTVKRECWAWLKCNNSNLVREIWVYPDGGGHVRGAYTEKEFLST